MLAAAGVSFGTEIWEEVDGTSMWVGRGVSVWVDDRGNLLQILRSGKTWRLISSGVKSEGNGSLLGGEACGMECEAKSKPHGTANLITHIPSGVMNSVSKKWSRNKNLLWKNPPSSVEHIQPTF